MSVHVPWLDARSYSKRFMVELIELFRSRPCLWRLKDGEPADREERDCAWELIVDKLREVEPNATRGFAIKKMNSFKSSWRREQKKVSQKRAGGDHHYHPRLWYYDIFGFIEDDGSPGGSGSSRQMGNASDTFEPIYDMDEEEKQVDPFADEDADAYTTRDTSTPQSTCSASSQNPGRAKSLVKPPDQPFSSRLDMLGRNWSEKLKLLPNDQRIYAEKLINDVLFEAELGTLGRHCHVATQAPPAPTRRSQ